MTGQRHSSPPPPVLGVVGPTGSGKSDLALALGRRLPIEIIVADSRQVVRGMDVGTASPDALARSAVPHHLLDVVEPDEAFTVADWTERARALLPQIASRGAYPMLVGGTGLYVEALVEGHHHEAPPTPALRAILADRLGAEGVEGLAAELRARDPAGAAAIDLRNHRRVVRALERLEHGAPARPPRSDPYPGRVALLALVRPRDVLVRRIEERARWMFTEGGLLDEVRALRDAGHSSALGPLAGHGYAEAAAVLDGRMDVEEAIASTARRTRQYAKRQVTWWNRSSRVLALPVGDRPANDPAVVDRAERLLRAALT
jgi:tRNA dimethylallyltransferase